jgi:hypothetical protein
VVTSAIVVAAVGVAAFIHHVRGARFQATVVPIRSLDKCIRATRLELQQAGYPVDGAEEECLAGDHPSIWFKVTVRNVGHRGAYLSGCYLRTFDRAGHATLTAMVLTRELNFPAGPYLSPGGTIFFVSPLIDVGGNAVLAAPAGTTTYEVACLPIDYHGNVPV